MYIETYLLVVCGVLLVSIGACLGIGILAMFVCQKMSKDADLENDDFYEETEVQEQEDNY